LARVKKRLAGEDLTKADASLIAFADKLSRERDELWSKFEAEKADNAAKLEAIKKEAEQKVAAAHADRDAAEAARRNYLFAALGVGLFAIGTLLLAFGGLIPGGRVDGGEEIGVSLFEFLIVGGNRAFRVNDDRP